MFQFINIRLLPCLVAPACIALFAAQGAFAVEHWVTYEGKEGSGRGKHIVLISGDEEYRSEEALPQLAKILAERHGFKCTVLFAINPETGEIDPNNQKNIPGLEALRHADMMIIATRFRQLPDEQMQYIDEFVESGKPIMGLRTATHAFNGIASEKYKKYNFNHPGPEWIGGFGQEILGDTWISHHGHHGQESTRGVVNDEHADHPVLRGVTDVWGPTDVYGIRNLPKNATVLLKGQVIAGMKSEDKPVEGAKNDPMMPLAWVREWKGPAGETTKVVATTMGSSTDMASEGLRRFLVNGVYWALDMDVPENANVEIVGKYEPTPFSFNGHKKGIKPSDHAED